ncbi:response regulator [Flavobacterium sp.]|uniref:response regulator n=1 Tax=Flavobacterium sp. TaxID=239 RepID=UPI002FD99177
MNKNLLLGLAVLLLMNIAVAQNSLPPEKEVRKLLNSADSCLYKSDYKNSLDFSSKALNEALNLNDNDLIARSYNTLAGNFEEMLETDKALDYYNKALFHFDKARNDTLIGAVYNNIGNIYFYRKNDFKNGEQFYRRAITISEKLNNTYSTVLTKLNLTLLNFEKNDFVAGIKHLDYVEAHQDQIRIIDVKSYFYILLARKYHYLKDNVTSENYFKKAIQIGIDNNSKVYLSDSYKDYSIFLFNLKRYKEAYEYLKKHEELKEEIFNLEKIRSAKLVGLTIALDDTKRQISQFEKEKNIQNESIKKSKIITILSFVFLLVMSLLLYILYRNNIYRQNINQFLVTKNEELKEAKEKAEEASKLKTQFISTISHELRTPLYGVVGITNMLSDEHEELKGSPHLNSLKFSARYLLSLVNDLLQINKIEENKVILENLTMNISDEINMVSNSLSFIANRNNNKIVTEIDSKIPEYLVGDKLRLSQILMNLVSNALKFTQDGTITIRALFEKQEDSLCYVKFSVEDTGMGIAEKDIEKIFDKFVQIDRKEDDYQGAGLGLSIVKKLIALFGSEIYVKSKLGEGTQFTFTIAFDADDQKVKEIINDIHVDLSNNHTYKVLVVEDNKINQMVTRKIMEKNNFKTVIVDDGYAAMEALNKEFFDVVLMDINMPLINGFETTRLIRKKGITIPIIALTAFAKDEITDEALSAGMNDVLIKPFEPSKLLKSIEVLLRKSDN